MNDHGRALLRAMLAEYSKMTASEDPAVAAEELAVIQEARAILDAPDRSVAWANLAEVLRGIASSVERQAALDPDQPKAVLATVVLSLRQTADLMAASS